MAAVARHPLSLMSCVREPPPSSPTSSSPPDPFTDHKKCSTGAGNSFRPLRGLRRIFRRKPRATTPALVPPTTPSESTSPAPVSAAVGTCASPEYLGRSLPGRSVSHDSVFTTEAVASAEHSASPSASDSAHSLQQLVSPTSAAVAAELVGALRRRGQCKDSSEDNAVKQDQNTCINGSSLSVASSNLEEEWTVGAGVPSSLLVSSSLPSDKSPSPASPVELEGVVSNTAPLSHKAARHKMAVKPRRNHGGPSRAGRRPHQVSSPSLPTTPELNEDNSVENTDSKVLNDVDPSRGSGFFSGVLRAGSATPPSPESEPLHGPSVEHQLKSASLPPGLALRPVAVTRSRSSATYHQTARENVAKYPRSGSSEQLTDRTTHQDPEHRDKEKSFFSRLLSRRSGKKKKKDTDDTPAGSDAYISVYASQDAEAPFTPRRMDERGRYAEGTGPTATTTTVPQYTANKQNKVSSVARIGPAARQRADPQTIPVVRTADVDSGDEEVRPRYDKASPLEGVPIPVKPEGAVTRMQISYSTSPTKPSWTNHFSSDEDLESKSKVRLPALSAFQKRVSAVASMKDSDDVESRSVRSELDSLEPPAPVKTISQDSLSRRNDNYSDVMELFEQEINTISMAHKGDSSCGSVDSLEPTKTEQTDNLTQNLLVASEEDKNMDVDMPSLDSIENQERCSSRAEDGHGIYQVTIPFGSDGVSITHRVMDLEEQSDNAHAVTVACCSPPSVSVPNITLISLTDTQQGIEKDDSDVSAQIETKPVEMERHTDKTETKHSDNPETSLPEKAETKYSDKVDRQSEKSESTLFEKVVQRHPEKTESEKTEKREKPAVPEKPDFSSEEVGLHHKTEEKPRPPVARKSVIHEETPAVPEFMRVQLNHVDSKPSVNVVLSTLSLDEKKRDDEEVEKEDTKKDQRRKSVEMIEAACGEKNVAVESSVVSDTVIVDPRNGISPKEAPSLKSDSPSFEQKADEVPAPSKSPVKPHKPFPLLASQKPTVIPPAKKSPVKKVPSKPDLFKSLDSPTEPIKKLFVEEKDKMVIVEKKKPSSPTMEEQVVLRRPSREISRDEAAKTWDPANTVHPEVVLRKKSLSREVGSKKDDECELMKVFARRSLKVKDGDETFVISQAWSTDASPDSSQEKLEEKPSEKSSRSRDSDKENDGAESPKDERKKEPKETKSVTAFKNEIIKPETKKDSLPEKRLRIRNIADAPNSEKPTEKTKFGRAALLRSESVEEKTTQPEMDPPKVASRWMPPPVGSASTPTPPAPAPDAASLPRFKRIQQRKEEWEQRAQQAAGKAAP